VDKHVASLFGDYNDNVDDWDESCDDVPKSPFVLTGLPPEIEEGNIEYKLKLVDPNPDRLEHLVTQMKWRVQEGQGEAIYEIGVEDCGTLSGVNAEELDASLKTLEKMADRLGASITILYKRNVNNDRQVVEVLVRKVPDDQHFIDLRVAILGNVDSGKSSLVGVLTHAELDNGRGRARLNLFRHLHEIQSGRTSSITHEILGFNDMGKSVDYHTARTPNEICDRSSKIITFIDLAGHHKYMKTTVFGLAAHLPDFAMLVINGSTGVVGTTREHFGFALALQVPVFVVINKIDLCSKGSVQQTVECLRYLLQHTGIKLEPFFVETTDDVVQAADKLVEKSICPIFAISCTTGENIDLLKKFLNILPPRLTVPEQERLSKLPVEYRIDEIYSSAQPDSVVVGGTLRSGTIHEGENCLVGPLINGDFVPIKVTKIQRYRVPRRMVRAGQSASLRLPYIEGSNLRKGMVIVSSTSNPKACYEFLAHIYLLHHANAIQKGFQATVHIENVRQTAQIIAMDKDELRINEYATVTFRFMLRSEYLPKDSRLIFRTGEAKGVGRVIQVTPC
ncbi:unnamed protein product, partial [Didymodactylos carnosus]